MEARTLVLDPTSHTASRSFFTIPAGLKYFTRRLRLLNFRILNSDSRPIFFGAKGIYSLVKNITVQDLTGTVIDQRLCKCFCSKLFSIVSYGNAR